MPEGMNIRDWSKKTLRMYGKLLDSHLPEERSSVISEKEFSELARNTAFIGAFAGFSGAYNETKQEYSFDISLHLKDLLNGEIKDSSLYIRIKNSSSYPHRTILKSGLDDIKLKVTYSKF